MNKIFKKHETLFCMLLIFIYILVNSICINNFGVYDYRSLIVNTIFSLCLVGLIVKLNRVKYYGLISVKNIKRYLYFIPLIVIISVNLWSGININNTKSEILFYILNMFNIGFIEEIIFRGFLFKMMEKDNVRIAIIVSSVTFGIGHIINLLNGSEFVSTMFQIISAISIGYLFVIIFYKSKSLMPCIITHSLFNAFSVFYIESSLSIFINLFLIIFPFVYAKYINRKC